MLRSFFTWLLVISSAALVAACCGSVACTCQDAYADAVVFRFNLDPSSANRFQPAQVDSVVLTRYLVTSDSAKSTPDKVRLYRPVVNAGDSILLNNNAPFLQTGTRKLNSYRYDIYLPRTKAIYHVRNINLDGDFDDVNGCCTCYRNKKKTLVFQGKPYDLTDATGKNLLNPIVITP
ncbi:MULTISPECIES: hypothetical protein [Hymenobacter]|uniref:Uncharacterized protein n=1 Tax=Hymenobacter jejuensis TaxID=2502781 RepID=A0A5B7ZWG9_9BACT|nr:MULTISPECIES: hypothetical protein [Hymenobacter]MBC6988477.1 hypothetical protein [Hymenobacter sp. BT491]QDA59169.1 hypothetical protein FHG12_03190 [Hymenobacter jejuensis]